MGERADAELIDWAATTRSRYGKAPCGDLVVVTALADGVLVAALDGLGHGHDAARAARAAGKVVRQCASGDLVALVGRCHRALMKTRGAAMSLAFVSTSDGRLSWLGIGNVEGRLIGGGDSAPRVKASLPLLPGVLGYELPSMRTAEFDVGSGDLLILATDGIEAGFADSLDVSGTPQAIAERILAAHGRVTDDALVVAVRYLGAGR
jgi:negative regulator of sigma-B (phosphoserine phosphatase)